MRSAKIFISVFTVTVFAVTSIAQGPPIEPTPANTAWIGTPEQKLWGLMTVWSEVNAAFPWFEYRPGLNWDAIVRSYIPRVLEAEDQTSYYRLLSELVTSLQDSHTTVVPPWGRFTPGFDFPPISIEVIDGKFLVTSVGDSEEIDAQSVHPGIEVLAIGNGRSTSDVFRNDVLPYRTMGSTHANGAILPFFLLYGPAGEPIDLLIAEIDGSERSISLTRSSAQRDRQPFVPRFVANMMAPTITVRRLEGGVLYIIVPNLGQDRVAQDFEQLMDATDPASIHGMILDLRGNMGGSSSVGNRIASCLVDQSVASPMMTYPLYSAAERAWGREPRWATEDFEIHPRDGRRHLGPLIVLTDAITHSSSEDLVIELLENSRATVVGEPTAGGAGNTIRSTLPGGGVLEVSTFRASFPDGREYVGKGIVPDHEISRSRQDIADGSDPVLDHAIELLRLSSTQGAEDRD